MNLSQAELESLADTMSKLDCGMVNGFAPGPVYSAVVEVKVEISRKDEAPAVVWLRTSDGVWQLQEQEDE